MTYGDTEDPRDECRVMQRVIDRLEARIALLEGHLGRYCYQCERCGGTGQQPAGCWTGAAYDSKAGPCELCDGVGFLGLKDGHPTREMLKAELESTFTALYKLANAAEAYAADQSGAKDKRVGRVQPVTVAECEELNQSLKEAWEVLK